MYVSRVCALYMCVWSVLLPARPCRVSKRPHFQLLLQKLAKYDIGIMQGKQKQCQVWAQDCVPSGTNALQLIKR